MMTDPLLTLAEQVQEACVESVSEAVRASRRPTEITVLYPDLQKIVNDFRESLPKDWEESLGKLLRSVSREAFAAGKKSKPDNCYLSDLEVATELSVIFYVRNLLTTQQRAPVWLPIETEHLMLRMHAADLIHVLRPSINLETEMSNADRAIAFSSIKQIERILAAPSPEKSE